MRLKLLIAGLLMMGVCAHAHTPIEVGGSFDAEKTPSHCYHWLRTIPENLLAKKIDFAKEHDGAFLHLDREWTYGSGIYCAYSLLDSIEYGDRVIRLNLDAEKAEQVKTVNAERHWYTLKTSELLRDSSGQPATLQTAAGSLFIVKTPTVVTSWSSNNRELRKDIDDTLRWLDQHPQYPEQQKLRNKLYYLLTDMQSESKKQGDLNFQPK